MAKAIKEENVFENGRNYFRGVIVLTSTFKCLGGLLMRWALAVMTTNIADAPRRIAGNKERL